jgi:hypothetical protein
MVLQSDTIFLRLFLLEALPPPPPLNAEDELLEGLPKGAVGVPAAFAALLLDATAVPARGPDEAPAAAAAAAGIDCPPLPGAPALPPPERGTLKPAGVPERDPFGEVVDEVELVASTPNNNNATQYNKNESMARELTRKIQNMNNMMSAYLA